MSETPPPSQPTSCTISFVPRIWFDEVERIGMRHCTPRGYMLNGVGGMFWVSGVLMFPGVLAYLGYKGIAGGFSASLLWWLTVPFAMVFIGSILIGFSWVMACRKEFCYDYKSRESTWTERGEKRSFSYSDLEAERRSTG